jgi:DNA-binding beta-propeller fold protein YncE
MLPSGGDTKDYSKMEGYIRDFEREGRGTQIPEFQRGLSWFNSAPLSVSRDLKGKILILDFWTYCCINCMHVLPELRRLEEDFAGKPFAVVGVHSAKFDNEKDDDAIRNAIIRYDVMHPAVNDKDMSMWRSLGINSWPSLLVVTPNGKVLARFAGEGHYEELKSVVSAALNVYGDRNELSNAPLKESLEKNKDTRLLSSPLRYPGKLAVDQASDRLFISDSGNHRVVVCKLDGTFVEEIGCGVPCLNDGSYTEAGFNSPQGLAYDKASDTLYVADTENHALRSVNLSTKKVRTISGDGTRGFDLTGGKDPADQKLNSPWDVCISKQDKTCVYVAMAGQHQIWSYDVTSGVGSVYSGNGYERNFNSPYPSNTSWAQPSGLSISNSGDRMYVADSESSSVRSVSLGDGSSKAEAGGDPGFADNLFAFGDTDGKGSAARLQHPLAVCAAGDTKVYVADSYNHKIKILDAETDAVSTIAGSSSAGYKDGDLKTCMLSEPAGLAMADDNRTLLVADTNNFLIRKIDLQTSTISTLDLSSVPRPNTEEEEEPKQAKVEKASDLKIPPGATLVPLNLGASTEGTVELVLKLPEGYHYTKGARSSYEIKTFKVLVDSSLSFNKNGGLLTDATDTVQLKYKRQADASPEVALVNMKIFYCKEESACAVNFVTFKLDFTAAQTGGAEGGGSVTTTETYQVPPPQADEELFDYSNAYNTTTVL